MTKYIIEGTTLSAIGNAIRGKTGETELIYPVNMPEKIDNVYDAGKQEKTEEMVGLAKTNPYDVFWDLYQDYGNRREYSYGFYGNDWNETTFKPKYPIIATGSCNRMFTENAISNLKQHCLDNNITIDLTGCTDATYLFFGSNTEYMPDCFRSMPNIKSFNRSFYGCARLKEISKIGSGNVTNFDSMFTGCKVLDTVEEIDVSNATNMNLIFSGCYRLREVRFAGVIPLSISFTSTSYLTPESLINIVSHLKNYKGTEKEGEYTLTLFDTSKTLLAQLGQRNEFNGLTYDSYITSMGWNLA